MDIGRKDVELTPVKPVSVAMEHSDTPFQQMPDIPPNKTPVPAKPIQHRRKKVEEVSRTCNFFGNHLEQYGDNTISTSKYSWWSFFPRSLFEQ
jgi:hypothetical protein